MSQQTRIEWTDATWNPVTGCSRVSPGCDHCYAEALAGRLKAMGNVRYSNGFQVRLHQDLVDLPLRWKKPKLIFVNSMSDLYHPKVPDEFIRRVFDTMVQAHWHRFQILSKRPQRMAALAPRLPWPANVWQGVSIESADYLWRIKYLLRVPAAVRFLSLEPLLGPLPNTPLTGIGWVIAGGESGPHHRPCDPDWIRSIRDQCLRANVPFFLKQWGGRTPKAGGRELDGRTWDEMP